MSQQFTINVDERCVGKMNKCIKPVSVIRIIDCDRTNLIYLKSVFSYIIQCLTYIRGLIQTVGSLFDMCDPRYRFFYLALTQILKYFLLTIKYRSFI